MASLLPILYLCALCVAGASADASTTTDLLWPMPQMVKFTSTVYSLDPATFSFKGTGAGGNTDIMNDALERYNKLIFESPAAFYPSGASGGGSQLLQALEVRVASADTNLGLNTMENYTLVVAKGYANIDSPNVYAALRGLETFSQLIYRKPDDSFAITEVTISDSPRFKFRGFMIDTARHYLNHRTILDHLDAMAFNKFNTLHWHLVDDQSFPYESITFPDLSVKGAYDSRHVYTQDFIREVIRYAGNRGIRVVPEFDTPRHSISWGLGQPNLSTPCYNTTTGQPDGTFGPINPTLDTTWTFLEQFFKEISQVFPDAYMHLGGDEVPFDCWKSNPQIQKWMAMQNYTDYSQLEQYYETRLLKLIEALNKQYIVWQDIVDNGLTVLPETVIDVWRGNAKWSSEMANVTKAGHQAILASCWYLNYISYGNDWPKFYQCDPQAFTGTDAQKALVVGGEACMWAEWVDSTNMLSRTWPRASAVGERLWSSAAVKDIDQANPRLHNMRCRMLSRGIPAEPIQGPSFCAHEWQ